MTKRVTGAAQAIAANSAALPHPDALMVALILAPGTFSRNKFYRFYEHGRLWQARRRAQLVRSLIKELTEARLDDGASSRSVLPPTARPKPIIEEDFTVDGETHLCFAIPELGYRRKARLSKVEAAALRYSLHRAGCLPLDDTERTTVEEVLWQLAPQLNVSSGSEPCAEPEAHPESERV